MRFRHATIALGFLSTIASSAPAQTFTTVDYPAADLTFLYGISGDTAVGRWDDVGENTAAPFRYDVATGAFSPINNPTAPDPRDTHVLATAGNRLAGFQTSTFTPGADYRGFLFDGATWNVFSVHTAPGGRTIPYGLDDATNTVVGSYENSTHTRRGFVRSPDGAVTTLQYPGSLETEVFDFDGDRIVGFYVLPTFETGGFLYDGLNWLPLNFPSPKTTHTMPYGIDGNLIVGEFGESDSGRRGFIYDIPSRTWTAFDAPVPNLDFTIIHGIDDNTIRRLLQDDQRRPDPRFRRHCPRAARHRRHPPDLRRAPTPPPPLT